MSDLTLTGRLRLTICMATPENLTEADEQRIFEAVLPVVEELASDLDHAERHNRRLQAEIDRLKRQ